MNVIWYTPFTGNLDLIGIVKVKTFDGVKYYIGTANGNNEEEDIEKIKKFGCPFYPEILKEF